MKSEDIKTPANKPLLIILILSLVGMLLLGYAWKFLSAQKTLYPTSTNSSTRATASPQPSTGPNTTGTANLPSSQPPANQPLVSKSKKACDLLSQKEAEAILNASLEVYDYSGGGGCTYYTPTKVDYKGISLILNVTNSAKNGTATFDSYKKTLTSKKVTYTLIDVNGANAAIWIPSYSQLYMQKANAILTISITQSGGNTQTTAERVADKTVSRL